MVDNPLEHINNDLREFANSSGDFSAMAPEKLIDISKNGEGREDFDSIIDDAIENNKKTMSEGAFKMPGEKDPAQNPDGSCAHSNTSTRTVMPTGADDYEETVCTDCGKVLSSTEKP